MDHLQNVMNRRERQFAWQVKILRRIAKNGRGKFIKDYPVHGHRCCAIICNLHVPKFIEACVIEGITGAEMEDHGKFRVIYWPKIYQLPIIKSRKG